MVEYKRLKKAAMELNDLEIAEEDIVLTDDSKKLVEQLKDFVENVLEPQDKISEGTYNVIKDLGLINVLYNGEEKYSVEEYKKQNPAKYKLPPKPGVPRSIESYINSVESNRRNKGSMKKAQRILMTIASREDSSNKEALSEMREKGIKYHTAKTILYISKTDDFKKVLPRKIKLENDVIKFV